MFPVTVRILSEKFGSVMKQIFDINRLQGRDASKAEQLFNSIDDQFTKYGIKRDYCAALDLENTNLNVGEFSSLKSRTRVKNENLIVIRCLCHILNNSEGKTGLEFVEK